MKLLSASIFLLIALTSCRPAGTRQRLENHFAVRRLYLPVDTTVQSIAYLNGHLLLLQENGKLSVLNDEYKREAAIEKSLSNVKAEWLFTYHDTVFAGNKDHYYYLNPDIEAIPYKANRTTYGDVFLEDSNFLVHGCCVGEFGGAIFFRDKKTERTFSYFATCPSQVLQFGEQYVVCNNLAHMGDHMSFLFVKDPRTLYEISGEKLKNHCNWYVSVDSLRNYWLKSNVGDVRVYDDFNAMSLVTFPYRDSLYSVLTRPKATILSVHRGDTTITVDTLLRERIPFHQVQVIEAGNKKVSVYKLTGGSPFVAYRTRGNHTGLIVVEGDRIDFLGPKISE
ncbi:MAG: hypothetical protein DI535_16525 [Citrobacter freundii]|nr:MAG: hypothetical protein DI535_16525 [Citrobacter freundii]